MTLSVIIPNYNNEQFLEKCLDSVLTQSVLPSEIIVVDDCSTDNSRQIIENYEKQFPSVRGIYLTENGGVSHARNTGILAAKGEYVTTLDADDFYYNPQKLENEMRILREHGGNALAYSKIVLCDESGNFIPTKNHPDDDYLQGEIFSDLMLEKKAKHLCAIAVIRNKPFWIAVCMMKR